MFIMLIIQVYFKCAVFQIEIKLVTHCYEVAVLYHQFIITIHHQSDTLNHQSGQR